MNDQFKFVCSECQSSDFFEDESEMMCCRICGTIAENFIAQSQEIDDGGMGGSEGLGRYAVKNQFGSRVSSSTRKEALKGHLSRQGIDSLDSTTSTQRVMAFLYVYQYILMDLSKQCISLIVGEDDQSESTMRLKDTIMGLIVENWRAYLQKWNYLDVHSDLSLNIYFDEGIFESKVEIADPDTDPISHVIYPVYPSKPLILAFIVLSLRQSKSPITHADIIRWCKSGELDYASSWSNLERNKNVPENINGFVKVLDTNHKSIFSAKLKANGYGISSQILWKQCVMLARMLESCNNAAPGLSKLLLPSLDVHVVARGYIEMLGLPCAVWENICEILKPIPDAERTNSIMHYFQSPEEIMALVIMAIKFESGWDTWDLVKEDNFKEGEKNDCIKLPSSSSDLWNMPYVHNTELNQILIQLEKRAPQVPERKSSIYNRSLQEALVMDTLRGEKYSKNLSGLKNIQDIVSIPEKNHWINTVREGEREGMTGDEIQEKIDAHYSTNRLLLQAKSPLEPTEEEMSRHSKFQNMDRLQNYYNQTHGKPTMSFWNKRYRYYVTYLYSDSLLNREQGLTSVSLTVPHTQYIVLLERCAKHLLCKIGLLHELLLNLEKVFFGNKLSKKYSSKITQPVEKRKYSTKIGSSHDR